MDGLEAREMEIFHRGWLLPAPSTNDQGYKGTELRYETGFALQSRVVSMIDFNKVLVFPIPVAQIRTLHFGIAYLPSVTTALGFPTWRVRDRHAGFATS